MKNATCGHCIFFREDGFCGRFPPQVIFLPLLNPTVVGAKPSITWQVNSAYPPVGAENESCGEFEPKPEVVN